MAFKPLRSTAPKTSILSPEFVYRDSASTDIRHTFKKYETKLQEIFLNKTKDAQILNFNAHERKTMP